MKIRNEKRWKLQTFLKGKRETLPLQTPLGAAGAGGHSGIHAWLVDENIITDSNNNIITIEILL